MGGMEETAVVMFPGHYATVDTGWSPIPTGAAKIGPDMETEGLLYDDGRSGCRPRADGKPYVAGGFRAWHRPISMLDRI